MIQSSAISAIHPVKVVDAEVEMADIAQGDIPPRRHTPATRTCQVPGWMESSRAEAPVTTMSSQGPLSREAWATYSMAPSSVQEAASVCTWRSTSVRVL